MEFTASEFTTMLMALNDRIFELKRHINASEQILIKNADKDTGNLKSNIEYYKQKLAEAHALQNKLLKVGL